MQILLKESLCALHPEDAIKQLPFSKEQFVYIPIRTKEQAAAAADAGARIFVEEATSPNGTVYTRMFCLIDFWTALVMAEK